MKNKLENSKILIIGAAGFIGSFLVKEILKELYRLASHSLISSMDEVETLTKAKEIIEKLEEEVKLINL